MGSTEINAGLPFIKRTNSGHLKAVFFLVATAILWSSGGMLIKLVTWNPLAIAGGRSTVAAIVMLAAMGKPKMKLSLPLIGGALMYSVTVILFVASTKLTTAANAILLQYTAPIYIALFGAWFLKERATLADWITITFVLGGMVLFFLDDLSGGDLLGNILAILSGISFAFTFIFMRKQKDQSPLESVFWGNVISAVICTPFMITGGMPDTSSLLGLGLLGVFQLGVAYILYSSAIKHITAIEGVLITVIEPILNPIWVMLVVHEFPGRWAIVGGCVVVSAVIMRNVFNFLRVAKT
jgi:drug/metabolite transporter (DMT)-like permease